jgi:hypothetical protein
MQRPLSSHSRRKLLRHFNALEDLAFVSHCLDLIHRGVDLSPFFRDSEFLYVDALEHGLDEYIRQQTGWIYLAANPVYPRNVYKLGMTRKAALTRMHTLETAGVLGSYVLAGSWPTCDVERTESRCHQLLADVRVDGEFFHLDYHSLASAIGQVLTEEDRAFTTLRELTIERG